MMVTGDYFVYMERLFVFNHLEYVLAGISTLLCLIQLAYFFISFARPLRKSKTLVSQQTTATTPMPVSVIVYTKNESENLQKHLPTLLEQDYPEFEVIVINDGSTDESDDVLKRFEYNYKNLYHTYIPEDTKYLSRKKLSLTVGIKAAKYDTLLFTEANCMPSSNQWIANMAAAYQEDTKIVLGFTAYPHNKGFFHKQVAYDNLVRGVEYLSSALKHHPFAGNGHNLSYKKELFFTHKGYSKFLNLQAGDDDLFINEVATRQNTAVAIAHDSQTIMAPIDYFGIWKEMKAARAATRKEYKGSQIHYYRSESVFFFLYLAATIATIGAGICHSNWLITVWAVLLYLLRYLSKGFIFKKLALLFGQHSPLLWMPILEITTPLFSFYIYIYRLFRGKKDYTFRLGNER